MTITVGTDSYISVAEADTIFASTFQSAEWLALTEANKEIALKISTKRINQLPFLGELVDLDQSLQFPRYICSKFSAYSYDSEVETPDDVKEACAYEALESYNEQSKPDVLKEAKANGISSIKLGTESYSFDTNASAGNSPISNEQAYELLSKWTQKGFRSA